jgi:hypothetical protein
MKRMTKMVLNVAMVSVLGLFFSGCAAGDIPMPAAWKQADEDFTRVDREWIAKVENKKLVAVDQNKSKETMEQLNYSLGNLERNPENTQRTLLSKSDFELVQEFLNKNGKNVDKNNVYIGKFNKDLRMDKKEAFSLLAFGSMSGMTRTVFEEQAASKRYAILQMAKLAQAKGYSGFKVLLPSALKESNIKTYGSFEKDCMSSFLDNAKSMIRFVGDEKKYGKCADFTFNEDNKYNLDLYVQFTYAMLVVELTNEVSENESYFYAEDVINSVVF